jgi:hypothetical protein
MVLPVLAVLIPDTPIYLPHWWNSAQHEGRSVRQWVKLLDSPNLKERSRAIFALGAIGPPARQAVPALSAILTDDDDGELRAQAALALSKMTPASGSAVSALAGGLEDSDLLVRMNCAIALFRLREAARPATAALIKALADDDNHTDLDKFPSTIQMIVALALGHASAGTAEGVPALQAALDNAVNDYMRAAAVRALGFVGTEAKPAVPKLRTLLRDPNGDVRRAAEAALLKIAGEANAVAPQADPTKELPEAERQYLWEIEHRGNMLNKHGFGRLARAIAQADPKALSTFLANDFTGTDLANPKRIRSTSDLVKVERAQDAGHSRALNGEAFIARLLDYRKLFPGPAPKVSLALMTLGPRERGNLDGLWEGKAQLRLHGEQAKGAPCEVIVQIRYQVPRPTEENLARPGWLRAAGVVQALTARAPRYLFEEVANKRGLAVSKLRDDWRDGFSFPTTGGVYVCDFDRDGILDMLITDINGCFLYKGKVGGFADVTARLGLPTTAMDHPLGAWVDLDGDGWEDLILGQRVYRNEGGKRFVDFSQRSNLYLPGDTLAVIVADYDRDGKLDLYITRSGRAGGNSWLDRRSSDPNGNYLFCNKGNWQFEDVTRTTRTRGGRRSTFTAAWLDANNDGWPDLHVPNEFGDGVLLINNQNGTFSERLLANYPVDFGTMGLAVGDINNDGNIDLYCANMYSKAGTRVIGNLRADAYPPRILEQMRRFVAGSQLHLNKGNLTFEQVGPQMQVAAVGWAYGACLADLDNDGFLDVYGTAGYVSRDRDRPDG